MFIFNSMNICSAFQEISGMPSTLKRDTRRVVSDRAGEPSSSGAMRKHKTDNSHPMQQ